MYIYKMLNFRLWNEKNREFVCAEGKGRPWKKDSSCGEKIAIRDSP
jgi:hypothetical protein